MRSLEVNWQVDFSKYLVRVMSCKDVSLTNYGHGSDPVEEDAEISAVMAIISNTSNEGRTMKMRLLIYLPAESGPV